MTFFPEFKQNYPSLEREDALRESSRVERERHEKERFASHEGAAPSKEQISLVSALNLLINNLSTVVEKQKKIANCPLPSPLVYAILDLRYFFEKMPELPKEAFPELHQHLSGVWLEIDTIIRMSGVARWKQTPEYVGLEDLISSINAFSIGGSKTFGHHLLALNLGGSMDPELSQIFTHLQHPSDENSPPLIWIKKIDSLF